MSQLLASEATRQHRRSEKCAALSLQNLRGQRDDLHEILLAQLAGDGPEDACPSRIARCVDDDCGVLVEGDLRSVVAAVRLLRPHDDCLDNLTLLDRSLWRRGLDRADDDVADPGVAPVRSAEHADAEELTSPRVVRDAQAGFLLDHFATSSTCARRQFLVFDSGRVSTMRTTSPTFAAFSASCAWNLFERRTTFLYRGCAFTVSTRTTIVLSIALETTTPPRSPGLAPRLRARCRRLCRGLGRGCGCLGSLGSGRHFRRRLYGRRLPGCRRFLDGRLRFFGRRCFGRRLFSLGDGLLCRGLFGNGLLRGSLCRRDR